MDVKEIAKTLIAKHYSTAWAEILGKEVYRHSERVCDFALMVADGYGLNLQEKIDLATGALLHDIGKSYVNQDILYKLDKLTQDDRMLIECHPMQGYSALKRRDFNKPVIDIVHYHHERLDKKGYPEQLSGKMIGLLVQIVSVADVYEALTARRVYHEPKTPEEAFCIMEADEGLNQVAVAVLKKKVLK